jgi:hypothetical protein
MAGSDGGKIGCGGMFALLVLVGLIVAGLQKMGCLPSEEGLQAGAKVEITATEVLKPKGLFVVKYTVKNDTRWPVALTLEWKVSRTTGLTAAANTVEFPRIAGREELSGRVMFDLEALRKAGIEDPQDRDVCRVTFSVVSVD